MWHEARKQEKKIRGMLVDYRRRAERRQDFYERIKADPAQFMQVHGRKCKVHLDPAVAMAGDSSTIMMPWQGQSDNIIDRFDARAHLDFIPPVSNAESADELPSAEERVINYERYRILAQNEFLCMSEEKFLQQLYLEEQFGANAQLEAERAAQKKAQKPQTGAAIGYTYEDSTGDYPSGGGSAGFMPSASSMAGASRASPEEDDSDSDLDVDVCININKLDVTQGNELNKFGRNYGMLSNDFYSFLTRDADEADALRLAREEEQEKVILSGRKSRRERRAQREKKFKRFMSPPSYAAKEEDFSEYIKEGDSTAARRKAEEEEDDESRSPSPVNSGVITYITSFGGEEEAPGPSTTGSVAKPNPTLTRLQQLRSQLTLGSILSEKRSVPPPPVVDKTKSNLDKLKTGGAAPARKDKSSGIEIVGRPVNYRSPPPAGATRRRPRSPAKRYSRSRSRSRTRRRSRRRGSVSSRSSRSRSRSSSRSSSASSRGSRRMRDRSRRSVNRGRSSSSRRRRRSKSSSTSRSSSPSSSRSGGSSRRQRRGGRSISPKRNDLRPEIRPKSPQKSLKSPLRAATAKGVETPVKTIATTLPPPPPPPLPVIVDVPIKRYYGRRREDHSDSELSFSDEEKEAKAQQNIDSNAPSAGQSSNTPAVARSGSSGNSSRGGALTTSLVTKSGGSGESESKVKPSSSSSGLNARDRLKRKMQSLLNKQYKADKKAEIEKTERQLQVQQERNEEMRELAIKLRKRQRELRHRVDGTAGGQSSDENLSDIDDYKSATQAATEDEEERLIQARLHKLVAMSRDASDDDYERPAEPEHPSSNRRHGDSSSYSHQRREPPSDHRRRRESDYSQTASHDYHTKRSRRDNSRERASTSTYHQQRYRTGGGGGGRDRSRSRSRPRSSRWDSQGHRSSPPPRNDGHGRSGRRLVDY